MAEFSLTEFDAVPWIAADESRPAVELAEIPAGLSDRGRRVLASNARLRSLLDESADGFPSDSERAYALAYHAGNLGLSKEDAAWLVADLYARPGKKRLHLHKLQLTLRAWAKGRDAASAQEAPSFETDLDVGFDAGPEPASSANRGQAPRGGQPPRTDRKTAESLVVVPAGGAEPFEVLAATEFLQASFTGATRLVPSIGLTERGVGLVTGAGGEGKSVLLLNLALAWAGASLPLSEAIPATRRLRVMVFQVEDAPGMVQERLRMMVGSATPPAGLFLFTRKEPMRFSGAKGRPNDRALERLGATLAAQAPIDLVVCDPLVYLHEAEENSSSEMMRWLVPLREVCRRAGAAILVIHHAGWALDGDDARGRGTTAIRAWADLEVALRAQTRGGRTLHRLNLVKTNFAPRWKQPLTLELDPDTLRFRVVDETATLCPPEDLAGWLQEAHGGSWTEKRDDLYKAICAQFGCEQRTAREAVKRAKDLRLLIDEGQRKPLRVVANSPDLPI